MTGIQILQTGADHPDAVDMIAQVPQEYVRRYGGPDESPFNTADFVSPRGAMFILRVDGEPAAMAGWRTRPEASGIRIGSTPARHPAEIKRMYVRPQFQRRGHARKLLDHLADSALQAGHDALILETGSAQPEAINLYASTGFVPVAPFGHYACTAGSRHFGRLLRALT